MVEDPMAPVSLPDDYREEVQLLTTLAMTGSDDHIARITDTHGREYTRALARFSCSVEAFAKTKADSARTLTMNGDDGWIRPVFVGNQAMAASGGESVLSRMAKVTPACDRLKAMVIPAKPNPTTIDSTLTVVGWTHS